MRNRHPRCIIPAQHPLLSLDDIRRIKPSSPVKSGNHYRNERGRYSSSGEINLRVSGIEQVLRHLDEAITGGAKEHIDGLSVNFPQWWFAARGSQTEPVLRLTVGAVNREILEEQTKHLIGVINQVQAPAVTADCN